MASVLVKEEVQDGMLDSSRLISVLIIFLYAGKIRLVCSFSLTFLPKSVEILLAK